MTSLLLSKTVYLILKRIKKNKDLKPFTLYIHPFIKQMLPPTKLMITFSSWNISATEL